MKFLRGLMMKVWKKRIKFDYILILILELYLVYEENKKWFFMFVEVLFYMLSVLFYYRLGYILKCL